MEVVFARKEREAVRVRAEVEERGEEGAGELDEEGGEEGGCDGVQLQES